MRIIPLAVALAFISTAALAQGTPGTTGGASGSIGGNTAAPAGANGDVSTPAPAKAHMAKKKKHSRTKKMRAHMAPESTQDETYGGTQIPAH